MNILYLTVTGETVGGAEISLYNLLENLDSGKFKPFVVMPFEGDYTQKISQLNIPVIILPFRKVKNPFNIIHSKKTVKRLVEIIRDYKIDLIHSNTQTGGIAFLGGVASRLAGIPFVWHPRVRWSGRILDLIQVFLSTKIIVISRAAKKRFWWVPSKNKIVIIYNGVNLERFNPSVDAVSLRKEFGCEKNTPLIGALGVSHPRKRYEYLVQAAKRAAEEIPDVRFVIVGFDLNRQDNYLARLKKLTESMGLENTVAFMEKRDDIPEVLSALDVFVFTSVSDAFGRVLIEAMASAKPVVAFRGGAVPEIVDDEKTGFLLDAKDFEGMAEKITYLLKHKEVRDEFGRSGKQRAEQLFDIKEHTRRVESLYLELLGEKKVS
jgi:glycosyltransferase involved in cell wall biosynthesis